MDLDPYNPDTDGDTVEDGVELAIGTDPLDPDDPPDTTDSDHDLYPDAYDEHPNDSDADGDGYSDGYELAVGTDPADSGDKPELGNVDGVNDANFGDAVVMFNLFLGNMDPEDFNSVSEDMQDVNRDGNIDTVDAVVLLNWYLGNIPYIPYP